LRGFGITHDATNPMDSVDPILFLNGFIFIVLLLFYYASVFSAVSA
jgi:hypothetical protein